ncbi:MAG: YlxR family protein [Anaerolineae bacterium]
MSRGGPLRRRHPQRICVGCRRRRPKRRLTRVMRLSDGRVAVDPTGKGGGRGAYLCDDPDCWERGVTERRLDNALGIPLDDAARAAVLAHAPVAAALPSSGAAPLSAVN